VAVPYVHEIWRGEGMLIVISSCATYKSHMFKKVRFVVVYMKIAVMVVLE
jgi:hypothetical protein